MKVQSHIFALGLALCAMTARAVETNTTTLPNIDDVMKLVLERTKVEGRDIRDFRAHYGFTRTRVTENRNSSGELTKRESRRNEHNPKTPVTPVSNIAGSVGESKDPPAGSEVRQDANGDIKGRAFERGDFALGPDLLKRFRFTMVGRETVNTRPTLLVDFKPARGDLPVRNLKDRFINKSAGRVWIDEKDLAVVKVDLHLTEPVNVVGGLVGAVRKCNYSFNRERTPDGLWYAADVKWHLEGRQFLVTKTIDYHETHEQVRKVW